MRTIENKVTVFFYTDVSSSTFLQLIGVSCFLTDLHLKYLLTVAGGRLLTFRIMYAERQEYILSAINSETKLANTLSSHENQAICT